jgi:DNA oxidative demethylase
MAEGNHEGPDLADNSLRIQRTIYCMPGTIRSGPPPEGFKYFPDFLDESEHSELLARMHSLEFEAFNFQGYVAKRRIVEYGWEYDFSSRKASTTRPLPEFLLPLRDRVAVVAQLSPQDIVEAVVTEYPPGAPIGWHRDVPQFEVVIGISLASGCRMRFRPYKGESRAISIMLQPRSLYILRGAARWQFQHSIPAVDELRYSITFRTLRVSNVRREA